MEKSPLWSTIVDKLKKKKMIGEEISLHCVNHGVKGTAKLPADFHKKFPEGLL